MALQAVLRRLLPESHYSALDTVEYRLLPIAGRDAGGHSLSSLLAALLRLVRHNDAVRVAELKDIEKASVRIVGAAREHELILSQSEHDDIDLTFDVLSSHDWFDGAGMRRMRGAEMRDFARDALPLMRCCMATYGWYGAIFFHSFNMEAAATEMDVPSQLARGLSETSQAGPSSDHSIAAAGEDERIATTQSTPSGSPPDTSAQEGAETLPAKSASGSLPSLRGDHSSLFSMATRAGHFLHTMAHAAMGDRHTVSSQLGLPSSSDVLYLHGEWKSTVGRTIRGLATAVAGFGSAVSSAVSTIGGLGHGGKTGGDGADKSSSTEAYQHVVDWHARESSRIAEGGGALNPYTLPKHMLLADHARKRLVLAVRGTMSMTDLVTDLTAAHLPFLKGEAHEGMATSAHALYQSALRGPVPSAAGGGGAGEHVKSSTPPPYSSDSSKGSSGYDKGGSAEGASSGAQDDETGPSPLDDDLIRKTMEVLQEQGSLALDFWLRDVYPGYGLAVTGHSLGGGVAVLFTMLLLDHRASMLADANINRDLVPFAGVDVSCFAFGPPPVFAPLSAVSKEANECIHCVVHEDDAVPRLSLLTVRELLQLLGKVCDAEPGFIEELLKEEGGKESDDDKKTKYSAAGAAGQADAELMGGEQRGAGSRAAGKLYEGGKPGAAIGSADVEEDPDRASAATSGAFGSVQSPPPNAYKKHDSGIVTARSMHRTVSRLRERTKSIGYQAPDSPSLSVASHSARPGSDLLGPTPGHVPLSSDQQEAPIELRLTSAANSVAEGESRGAVGLGDTSIAVPSSEDAQEDAATEATASSVGPVYSGPASGAGAAEQSDQLEPGETSPQVEAALRAVLSEVQGEHDRMFYPGQIYLLRTPPPCTSASAKRAFGSEWPGADADQPARVRASRRVDPSSGTNSEAGAAAGSGPLPVPAAVPALSGRYDDKGESEPPRKDALTASAEGTRPWLITRAVAGTARVVGGLATNVASTVSAPLTWIGGRRQVIPVGAPVKHAEHTSEDEQSLLDMNGGDASTERTQSDPGTRGDRGSLRGRSQAGSQGYPRRRRTRLPGSATSSGDSSSRKTASQSDSSSDRGFDVRNSSLRMARLVDELGAIERGVDVESRGDSEGGAGMEFDDDCSHEDQVKSDGSSVCSYPAPAAAISKDAGRVGRPAASMDGSQSSASEATAAADQDRPSPPQVPSLASIDQSAQSREASGLPRPSPQLVTSRRQHKQEPINRRVGKLRRTQSMDSVQSLERASPKGIATGRRRASIRGRTHVTRSPARRRIAWVSPVAHVGSAVDGAASNGKESYRPARGNDVVVQPNSCPASTAPIADDQEELSLQRTARHGPISAHSTSSLGALGKYPALPSTTPNGTVQLHLATAGEAAPVASESVGSNLGMPLEEREAYLELDDYGVGGIGSAARGRSDTQPSLGSRLLAMVSFSSAADTRAQAGTAAAPLPGASLDGLRRNRSSNTVAGHGDASAVRVGQSSWQWGFPSLGISMNRDDQSSALSSRSSTTMESDGTAGAAGHTRTTAITAPVVVTHGSSVPAVTERGTAPEDAANGTRGATSSMFDMIWGFGRGSRPQAQNNSSDYHGNMIPASESSEQRADSITHELRIGAESHAPAAEPMLEGAMEGGVQQTGVLVPRYEGSVTTADEGTLDRTTPNPGAATERHHRKAAELLASYKSVSSFGSDHADGTARHAGERNERNGRLSSALGREDSLAAESPIDTPGVFHSSRWDAADRSAAGAEPLEGGKPSGRSSAAHSDTVEPKGSDGRPAPIRKARLIPRYRSSDELTPSSGPSGGATAAAQVTPSRRYIGSARVSETGSIPSHADDLLVPGSAIRKAGEVPSPLANSPGASAWFCRSRRDSPLASPSAAGGSGAAAASGPVRSLAGSGIAVRLDYSGAMKNSGNASNGECSAAESGDERHARGSDREEDGGVQYRKQRPRGGGPWPQFAPCVGAQVTDTASAECLRDVIPTSRSIPDHMPDRYLLLCRRLHEWYVEVPPAVRLAAEKESARKDAAAAVASHLLGGSNSSEETGDAFAKSGSSDCDGSVSEEQRD